MTVITYKRTGIINSKGRHPILFVRFLFIWAVHVLCIYLLYYIVSSVGYKNVKKLNISFDDGQALQKAIRETFSKLQVFCVQET